MTLIGRPGALEVASVLHVYRALYSKVHLMRLQPRMPTDEWRWGRGNSSIPACDDAAQAAEPITVLCASLKRGHGCFEHEASLHMCCGYGCNPLNGPRGPIENCESSGHDPDHPLLSGEPLPEVM